MTPTRSQPGDAQTFAKSEPKMVQQTQKIMTSKSLSSSAMVHQSTVAKQPTELNKLYVKSCNKHYCMYVPDKEYFKVIESKMSII